jgi:hypothetical protein
LVGDASSQVAEAEPWFAKVTADLTVVEDLGEGKGQDPNHGEDEQGLVIALMQRGLLERTVGGDGLKDVGIDLPATAAQLNEEQGRDGAQLQIAGIEVGAVLDHGFFADVLVAGPIPVDRLAPPGVVTHGFDDGDVAGQSNWGTYQSWSSAD